MMQVDVITKSCHASHKNEIKSIICDIIDSIHALLKPFMSHAIFSEIAFICCDCFRNTQW